VEDALPITKAHMPHSIQFDYKLMHALLGDSKLAGKFVPTHWAAQCLQEPLGSLSKPLATTPFLIGDGFETAATSTMCHSPLMVSSFLDEPDPLQRVECAQGRGEI
jgi:hypothetical protein